MSLEHSGWMDRLGCLHCHSRLFSDGRSFLPTVSPLTLKGQRCLKGRFTEKSARVPSAY